jgi:hypothetical protein
LKSHISQKIKDGLYFNSAKLPVIDLDVYTQSVIRTIKSVPETAPARGAPQARAHNAQIPRRAIGARNARARLRATGKDHIGCLSFQTERSFLMKSKPSSQI